LLVKGEAIPVLKHHATKDTALDGSEWSVSRPGRSTHRERDPGTRWKGGWVGPKAGSNVVVKRKFLAPAGTRNVKIKLREF